MNTRSNKSAKRNNLLVVLQQFVDFVFGFDFFISYAHDDGLQYPEKLADRLGANGFRVFLDRREYVAGIDLHAATRRRIRMSKTLCVIARPKALVSGWVLQETQTCIDAGRDPVVIDINSSLDRAKSNPQLVALLQERLRIDETLDDPDGDPSTQTVEALHRSFRATRQESLRLRVFAGVAAAFAIIAALAVWQSFAATAARDQAMREAALARSRNFVLKSEAALNPDRKLELAINSIHALGQIGEPPSTSSLTTLRKAVASRGGVLLPLSSGSAPHFSPDGQWLFSGGTGSNPRIWNLNADIPRKNPHTLGQVANRRHVSFAFSPDNQWFALGEMTGVTLWPLPRLDAMQSIPLHTQPSLSDLDRYSTLGVKFSPDGKWLLTTREGFREERLSIAQAEQYQPLACIWNLPELATKPACGNLAPFAHFIEDSRFSADSRWLLISSNEFYEQASTVRFPLAVYDLQAPDPPSTKRLLVSSKRIDSQPNFILTAPVLLAGESANVRLWRLDRIDQKSDPRSIPSPSSVRRMGLSPDTRWLVTAGDHELHLWRNPLQLEGGRAEKLDFEEDLVEVISFSGDSRWLVASPLSGNGYKHYLWQLPVVPESSPVPMGQIGEGQSIEPVFSPDSQWLAYTNNGDVTGKLTGERVWIRNLSSRAENERPIIINSGPAVNRLVFSGDGRWLAIDMFGLTIVVDLETASRSQSRMEFSDPDPEPAARKFAAFSPDSRWLAIPGSKGIHLIPLKKSDVLRVADFLTTGS